MPSATRRFIAGAVCPRCAAMDTILVDSDTDHRECVECGFTDERPGEVVREPATRVSRASARRTETPAEPVRLMDPGKAGKSD